MSNSQRLRWAKSYNVKEVLYTDQHINSQDQKSAGPFFVQTEEPITQPSLRAEYCIFPLNLTRIMNIKSFQVVIYHMTKEESESTISHEIRKPYITVVNNMVAIRTSPCWVAFPLDFFRITRLRCTPYFCCNSSTVNQP